MPTFTTGKGVVVCCSILVQKDIIAAADASWDPGQDTFDTDTHETVFKRMSHAKGKNVGENCLLEAV